MQKQEAWDDFPDPWAADCAVTAPLHACDLRTARRARSQRNTMFVPLMGCPPLVIPVLCALHAQSPVPDKEGAHGKRSVTR
jgi:hypothetical protein